MTSLHTLPADHANAPVTRKQTSKLLDASNGVSRSSENMKSIYRSLIVISLSIVFGNFSAMLVALSDNLGSPTLSSILLAGLLVNSATAINFFAYYFLSTQYREITTEPRECTTGPSTIEQYLSRRVDSEHQKSFTEDNQRIRFKRVTSGINASPFLLSTAIQFRLNNRVKDKALGTEIASNLCV
ncbi:hypothetical protein OSTOST_01450 [Ostertagia ostertagi]